MNVERLLRYVSIILVIVAAINWGLVGAFDYNFVTAVVGQGMVMKVIYIVFGVAGLYLAYLLASKKV